MTNRQNPAPASPAAAAPEPVSFITLGDIYFALFRQKWLILICTLAGIAAGIVYFFMAVPPYQSEARMLIRYIQDSRSASGPNSANNNTQTTIPSDLADSIINAEMAILISYDLAQMVVSNIGPDRILAAYHGPVSLNRAASYVRDNLIVEAPPKSAIIQLTYQHPDPSMVPTVLREVVADYLLKSAQVHQAGGTSYDFLNEQASLLHDQIVQTEDDLRAAKTNAGIISVEESDKTFSTQVSTIEEELFQSDAQLAGYQALLKGDTTTIDSLRNMPVEKLDKYQRICDRLDFLSRRQNEYVTQLGYKDGNVRVVAGQAEIDDLKKELADEYPGLGGLTTAAMGTAAQTSPLAPGGIGGLIPLLTKIDILKEQLKQIWSKAADEDLAKSKINDLERKRQILQANYEYFSTTLEQTRIDEALGPGKVSNISVFESPTPPFQDLSKFHKKIFQIMAGGLGAGIALALLIELLLDQRVKRPGEIESRLHLRLFLSIPHFKRRPQKALPAAERPLLEGAAESPNSAGAGSSGALAAIGGAPADATGDNSFLYPYYDTLRDRLISYFESVNLTRKPKLVAVTSTEKGAGVSTIAAGLADSLSETGDGRVLLVRMNLDEDGGQNFFNGKPACELDDALLAEKRDSALVHENLYVVEEISRGDKRPRVLPKRFAALVPKFKASDYDYIIFDMPPVSQTSVTARLAGLVDMTLLVVESEKSNREVVRQASALLAQSKATVGVVLNKTRKYVPARLHQDFLEEG
jgi:uncharacterized protein involved in exopolysaccharide biosynthesis/Mrp family chromosome partitioning ATPase